MPRNLPIYRSPFSNAFALLLLLAFIGLSTGCNIFSIGGPPSPPVSAIKGTISEFILSQPQSGPENITSGPDGKLWFTEPGVNGQTGKIGSFTLT